MKLIATHINADFDGFAAMIGLLKLHPDASLVFPGSQEPGVRQFLKETPLNFPETAVRDVGKVEHLILVDVSRNDRLGNLASVLQQQPRPFIEIYDHHPASQSDIEADVIHPGNFGSTTTIVVREMIKAEESSPLVLTSLEASLLLTGIYEDTANFLSSGTTEEDLQAALFLLRKGAEIAVVNRLLTHRLSPDQVSFFNTMVSNCETVNMKGNPVVISSFSWPVFVPEAAYLVHRLMDLEPIDLFFAIILMENRVHIIARSLLPEANVGEMMSELGGGGHKMAASAVLKGVTLIEAREKLFALLGRRLLRGEKAKDLMKTNIISIASKEKLAEAADKMNSFRINALVVKDKDKVVGTISRQTVDGAIFHGLENRPVRDYMTTELPLIDPETPLSDVLRKMISDRIRFVLVGTSNNDVEGIITRMDLLRFHYELSDTGWKLKKGRRSEDLKPMLRKRLPEPLYKLLEECGEVAGRIGYHIYLVGGVVRDLILRRENTDIDLVVEGDGIHFAEEFKKQRSCQIFAHKRFGTARLVFGDGFKIDVATARTESYHAPAALPQVYGGILRQDLYRRDFTINTLAIDLSPDRFGKLIDYFGGWEDIHEGSVRVLHSLSFIDDPTRTLRAIRFATRFNFQISKDTSRLIYSAVESRVLDRLSGKRFWTELKYLLKEEHPIPAIRLLHHYKLLPAIHQQIQLDAGTLDLLYRCQSVLSWFQLNFLKERVRNWLLYLMAVLEKLDRTERMALAQKFQLTADIAEVLKLYKKIARDVDTNLAHNKSEQPSKIYFALHGFPAEVLLYAMARTDDNSIKQQIALFLRDLRLVKLDIDGNDILASGMKPGPSVRAILEEILRARLDGKAASRQKQLELAGELIRQTSNAAGVSPTGKP